MTTQEQSPDEERRQRLLEAIRRLKEMDGSPDLLEACMRALEELTGG
mgnify:CR=1 FL=1